MAKITDIDATLEELKACYEYIQRIRYLMFWMVEPGESRDDKALAVIAEAGLE